MLLEARILLRSHKLDGSAVTADEYLLLGNLGTFYVEGIGVKGRSVNLVGCSLHIDSFKGRGASEHFLEALRLDMGKFVSFLTSIDEVSFKSFLAAGIRADVLLAFKIDEITMDFEIHHTWLYAISKLGLSVSILVDQG